MSLTLQLPPVPPPESAMLPGMAAPAPRTASPPALIPLAIPDTSIGPVALQEPLTWNYDFDPTTGSARASYPGEVSYASVNVSGNVTIGGTLQVGGTPAISGFGTGIGQALGPLISRGGLPSLELHGQLIFNQASPTNATGPDLLLRHDGSGVSGGSGATINQVLQLSQTVGATDATQNWTLVSKMNTNNTVGAQALAGYLQSWRNAASNGWIWGAVIETTDFTGNDSATVGNPTTGVEIDLGTSAADNAINPSKWGGFGNRHLVHFVATRKLGAVENEISTGLWFGTSNSHVSSIIGADLGAGAAGAATYQVLDARGFIAPAAYASPIAAVRLSQSQIIDFNGGPALNSVPGAYLQYRSATGRLYYVVSGVDMFSVDASGNVRAKGTVTPSTTP